MRDSNFKITQLLRGVTALECAVLVFAGGGLFFLPSLLNRLWPWAITPFNGRFLGAVYLASLVSTLLLVIYQRWSPTRIVLPMILAFTSIVLIVSLLYIDRFTVPVSTIAWLILYVGLPVSCLYHLWLYRSMPPAPPEPIPPLLQRGVQIQAAVLGLYGIMMLIAPSSLTAFWPWPIDEFHGRMYSVTFITPAVGAWLLTRSSTHTDLLTLGLTGIVGGLFPILGTLWVNTLVPIERQINFGLAGTWLWFALFASMFASGVLMAAWGRVHGNSDISDLEKTKA
jgi:hypothetical protein